MLSEVYLILKNVRTFIFKKSLIRNNVIFGTCTTDTNSLFSLKYYTSAKTAILILVKIRYNKIASTICKLR